MEGDNKVVVGMRVARGGVVGAVDGAEVVTGSVGGGDGVEAERAGRDDVASLEEQLRFVVEAVEFG